MHLENACIIFSPFKIGMPFYQRTNGLAVDIKARTGKNTSGKSISANEPCFLFGIVNQNVFPWMCRLRCEGFLKATFAYAVRPEAWLDRREAAGQPPRDSERVGG
jgi:hypothetical protein